MSDSKWTFAHNFCADFQSKAADITSRLDQLKYSTAVTPDRVQAVAVDLSRLAKDLSEATGSLPSYDQRQCETVCF
ncbi:hypothetical protein ID866_8013 [Astraeus odoratus]|nr:hypothetical protein ID866_8013 [Astraeus odoratus]